MIKKRTLDLTKISKIEQRMIEEILSMKRRTVNKIMVPVNEVVAFAYDQTLSDVIVSYKQNHYSRYPVYFKKMDQIVSSKVNWRSNQKTKFYERHYGKKDHCLMPYITIDNNSGLKC